MSKRPPDFTCVICKEIIHGQYGNNAWPIIEGRCCDLCNADVIMARMDQIRIKPRRE
jgi:hypothetical protein